MNPMWKRSIYPHLRFIAVVGRRVALIRGAEHLGLCLIGTAGLCLITWPIWIRLETTPLHWGIVGGFAITFAALFSLWKQPDLAEIAGEVDRQLGLHALFSTALLTRENAFVDPAWLNAVRDRADRCCKSLAPSDLVLHRLGYRAWSGIALTISLLAVIVMFSTTISTPPNGSQQATRNSIADHPKPRTSSAAQPLHEGKTAIEQSPGEVIAGSKESETSPGLMKSESLPGEKSTRQTVANSSNGTALSKLSQSSGLAAVHTGANSNVAESSHSIGNGDGGLARQPADNALAPSGTVGGRTTNQSHRNPTGVNKGANPLNMRGLPASGSPPAYRDLVGAYFGQ